VSEHGYHEPYGALSAEVRSIHRGIVSVIEELEAVDWYRQRADLLTDDDDLRSILVHNMNEELEHAAMVIEWLRRRMPRLDAVLRQYLFTEGPVVEKEEEDATGQPDRSPDDDSLGIAASLPVAAGKERS
jgi:hypothetical protein